MLKSRIYSILFVSWMLFITFLSLFSFSDNSLPRIKIPNLDKAVHFTFYFVASVLGCLFVRQITKGNKTLMKTCMLIFISMVAYGIIIEVLQMKFTMNRHGDVLDVLANSLGAFFGVFVIKYVFFKKTQLKWKN